MELWRVVLSDGHDDVAAGGGEFELREELAGAVPQRHLPERKTHPEGTNTRQIELHKPAAIFWISLRNPFKKGNSIGHLHIEKV